MAAQRRHAGPRHEANRQRALAVHGIARVDRHVDQRRLELAGGGAHVAGLVRNIDDDADARARDGIEHVGDRADALCGIKDFRLQRLSPREGEELACQLRGPVHRVRHGVEIALAPLLREAGAAQQIRRRADDRQQIVEIMRNAAGELTHGLHLLRLA